VICDVQVFPLQVNRQQGDWPEKQERSRIWVAARKAARLVKKAGLRRAIKNFESRQVSRPGDITDRDGALSNKLPSSLKQLSNTASSVRNPTHHDGDKDYRGEHAASAR
jgi:hypothetical protein